MYTKEEVENVPGKFYILDPEGCILCSVYGAITADGLLSHLNRG